MCLPLDCFDVEEVGDVTEVRFAGPTELDDARSMDLVPRLLELASTGNRCLHVDLGNVRYVSSGGLGQFVGLHKRLRAQGAQLVLRNVPPEVYEVFEITRLHTIMDIRPA
jgi:anti-anti-sigma factor